MTDGEFKELIWEKGRELYRGMPWRDDTRPYYVLVSELMLQQTQVDRVIPKFKAFIERFPDERSLAAASLADALTLWSGLGYNRRAKFLHESAKKIMIEFNGSFPKSASDILSLPGVGPGTAGAIMTYAFNQPIPFIETNVRTVYFHHFFDEQDKISDAQLLPVIQQTLDNDHPREFYWALMDYGTWLKKNGVGRITQSKHYKKQSTLRGSVRELRGIIIKQLAADDIPQVVLHQQYADDERLTAALSGLLADGLVTETDNILHLTK
ncbi:MAG: mutY [Candidatus Saccharibacteria bacterium]|jgi:A/G-specific adenine glycosylase|nr:mutY [Candidatus Saccharibacteria bacterium]